MYCSCMLIELLKKTVKYSAAIPVAVGKAVRASAYTIEGKMDVTWKGQVITKDPISNPEISDNLE